MNRGKVGQDRRRDGEGAKGESEAGNLEGIMECNYMWGEEDD